MTTLGREPPARPGVFRSGGGGVGVMEKAKAGALLRLSTTNRGFPSPCLVYHRPWRITPRFAKGDYTGGSVSLLGISMISSRNFCYLVRFDRDVGDRITAY